MKAKERRTEIINMLTSSDTAISGSQLSESFKVSRQIIVSDISALKESGYDILSTSKGYKLGGVPGCKKVIKVRHTDEEIEDELTTIVDLGGKIIDVFIRHRVYGEMHAKMNIVTKRDIALFLDDLKSGKSNPLKNITSNYHYHTIEAQSEQILDLITQKLAEKNMLADMLDYEKDMQ